MPEPLTLDELLGRMAEFIGDDKEKAHALGKAIARTESVKPLTEVIKKRGANEAHGELNTARAKITELQGQVTLLTEQIEEKEGQIQQFQTQAPDWDRKLKDTERRYQEKLRAAEEEAVQAKNSRRQDKIEGYKERFLSMLLPHMRDEDYARYTALPKYSQFIDLDAENKLVVKEPGEGVPYDPARGDPLKQLLADALDEIKPDYKVIPQISGGAGTDSRTSVTPQRPRTTEEVAQERKKSGIYAM